MKIAYLGAGAWGSCLANLLAEKGHNVFLWARSWKTERKRVQARKNLVITRDLRETVSEADFIIESVTSSGLRECLCKVCDTIAPRAPLILTSKGIEQNTLLLLPEVATDVLGAGYPGRIGYLSGPSLACEVTEKMPTAVNVAAYDSALRDAIVNLFSTPYMFLCPTDDLSGVAIGGAMKNIVAIACAISDGLGFGFNTKATLMTRGFEEMCQLGVAKGCRQTTLNGPAGMGDLFTTCLSTASRNYGFGMLLAQGFTPDEAHKEIGMTVEGIKTCISALEIGKRASIPMPVTEAIYSIVYRNADPKETMEALLGKTIQRELACER